MIDTITLGFDLQQMKLENDFCNTKKLNLKKGWFFTILRIYFDIFHWGCLASLESALEVLKIQLMVPYFIISKAGSGYYRLRGRWKIINLQSLKDTQVGNIL